MSSGQLTPTGGTAHLATCFRTSAVVLSGLTLDAMFMVLEAEHGLVVRFDLAGITRRYMDPENPHRMFYMGQGGEGSPGKMKVPGVVNPRGTVAEVLSDVVACLPGHMTYRVRGNTVLITPAYMPQSIPNRAAGQDAVERTTLEGSALIDQANGVPVSAAFDQVTLSQAVSELRRLTGANIVAKLGVNDGKVLVTATFDDVRLFTALEILGDMADLRPVAVGNVFYLTDEASAQRLQIKANREQFGEPRAMDGSGASTLSPFAPVPRKTGAEVGPFGPAVTPQVVPTPMPKG